jgi:hypothetical protein
MVTTISLERADREHVRAVDAVMREASRRSSRFVRCRRGCTPCCIGRFDITALDAVRRVRALQRLRRRRPRVAGVLLRRALTQWRVVAEEYPDDRRHGVFGENERLQRERGCFGDTVIPGALALREWSARGGRSRSGTELA